MAEEARAMTRNEQLQRAFREYEDEGHNAPVDLAELARWAIARGKWVPNPRTIEKQCQKDFATAFRQEYITASDGKRVRAKHAIRSEQGVLWDDIRNIPRQRMELSLRQRRQQIVSDCYQPKCDADYFNSTHPAVAPIQLVFNFENDLIEMELEKDGHLAA